MKSGSGAYKPHGRYGKRVILPYRRWKCRQTLTHPTRNIWRMTSRRCSDAMPRCSSTGIQKAKDARLKWRVREYTTKKYYLKNSLNMDLNKLAKEAYETAREHGWNDEEHSNEHGLMLILTEIAEAVNADRKNQYADVAKFKEWQGNSIPYSEETRTRRFNEDFEAFIKNTVEDELADVVIRCLDLAGLRGIDLTHALDCMDELSTAAFDECTFTETAYCMCSQVVTGNTVTAVLSTIDFVFHYCKAKGIDIEWFIAQKMKYNKLRPYRHGDKKY